jgi:hypothetical protein
LIGSLGQNPRENSSGTPNHRFPLIGILLSSVVTSASRHMRLVVPIEPNVAPSQAGAKFPPNQVLFALIPDTRRRNAGTPADPAMHNRREFLAPEVDNPKLLFGCVPKSPLRAWYDDRSAPEIRH